MASLSVASGWRPSIPAMLACLLALALAVPGMAVAAGAMQLECRTDQTRPFNRKLLGLMQDSPPQGGLSYERFFALPEVQALAFQTFRFPGGTEANFYHWATDRFDPQDLPAYPVLHAEEWRRQLFAMHGPSGEPVGFSAVADWASAQRKTVVFTLNLLTEDSPSAAIEKLSAAKARGLAVDFVELGNELYFKDLYGPAAADPDGFAARAGAFAAAIRKAFPQCRIGVPVANTIGNRFFDQWDRAAASLGPLVDAFILHVYPEPRAPRADYLSSNAHRAATRDFQASMDHYARLFPGKQAWISEWNYGNDPTPQLHNSVYGVIWAAQFFLALARDDRVELALYHRVAGSTHSLLDIQWLPEGGMAFHPNLPYVFWKELGRAGMAADAWAELRPAMGSSADPAVEGVVLLGKGRGTALLLNLGRTPARIDLRVDGARPREATVTTLSAGSLGFRPEGRGGLPPTWPATGPMGDTMTLPPHAIGFVSFLRPAT